jgi:hypothetical protein
MPEVPAIYLKLRDRKPHPLSPSTFSQSVDFFRSNPESLDCYVFANGEVRDGEAYRKQCSGWIGSEMRGTARQLPRYTHSVVLISCEGIPLNVSRTRSDIAATLGEPDWFARRFPESP